MTGTRRLEQWLAALLRNGSWLASAIIGLGIVLALIDARFGTRNLALLPNLRIATFGIALLILLPTRRVLLMLTVFLRQRDFRFAFIAAIVLAMIFLGIVAGLAAKHGLAG
jgi:uncharacterized membrane protein